MSDMFESLKCGVYLRVAYFKYSNEYVKMTREPLKYEATTIFQSRIHRGQNHTRYCSTVGCFKLNVLIYSYFKMACVNLLVSRFHLWFSVVFINLFAPRFDWCKSSFQLAFCRISFCASFGIVYSFDFPFASSFAPQQNTSPTYYASKS